MCPGRLGGEVKKEPRAHLKGKSSKDDESSYSYYSESEEDSCLTPLSRASFKQRAM
jgi:hypothetical protein